MKERTTTMNDLLTTDETIAKTESPTEMAADATPIVTRRQRKPMKPAKPTHYKVICISMYTRDLDELSTKVNELKKRGMTKLSKSELIRIALDRLDLDQIQPPKRARR